MKSNHYSLKCISNSLLFGLIMIFSSSIIAQAPVVIAPDDVTVSCAFEFDLKQLKFMKDHTFGKITTKLGARKMLVTKDVVCDAFCSANDTLGCYQFENYFDTTNQQKQYEMIWGWDGYVSPLTGIIISLQVTDHRECGYGLITRDLTAMVNGDTISDRQNIWVVACDELDIHPTDRNTDMDDVIWPFEGREIVKFSSCTDFMTDINKGPGFVSDAFTCTTLSIDFRDYFSDNPRFCFELIRDWRIVNWCTFNIDSIAVDSLGNPYGASHPHPGEWHFRQLYQVNDTVPPIIECSIVSSSIVTNKNSCRSHVDIEINIPNECFPNARLTYQYTIDLDNDGHGKFGNHDLYVGASRSWELAVDYYNPWADNVRNVIDPSGSYPVGTHKIYYKVNDGCGNIAEYSQVFKVKDIVSPDAICHYFVITAIMTESKSVTIKADEISFNSTDNCTSSKNLNYYFNGDRQWTEYIINCDSFINHNAKSKLKIDVELWVEDESGNIGTCKSQLEIHDVNNVCDTTSAVNDISVTNDFIVSPNPVISTMIVALYSKNTGAASFQIKNLNGSVVWQDQLELSQGENDINLERPEGLSSGIYIFEIRLQNQKWVKKIVLM